MPQFVDVGNMSRWIQREGVERLMSGMIGYLEEDFRRWERFDKVPRIANHTPFGVIELMPTSDHETYAFKYVNGHHFSPARYYSCTSVLSWLGSCSSAPVTAHRPRLVGASEHRPGQRVLPPVLDSEQGMHQSGDLVAGQRH